MPSWLTTTGRLAVFPVTTAVTAGLVLVPVPAQAAAITSGQHYTSVSFGEPGGAPDCTETSTGSSSPVGNFTSNGVTYTRFVSDSAVIADPGDPDDTTSLTASSRSVMRATEAGGSLRTLNWKFTFRHRIDANQGAGTGCDASAESSAISLYEFTLTRNKWATFTADMPRRQDSVILLERTAPASPVWEQTIVLDGIKGTARFDVFLPAGTYEATNVIDHMTTAPQLASDPDPAVSVSKGSIRSDIVNAGSAKTKAQGVGKQYVGLPAARRCGPDKLTTKWRPPTGQGPNRKVQQAKFFVNGDLEKTVNNPQRGQRTTLNDLDDNEAASVRVMVKLKAGGTRKVTRSYLPCA